MTKPSNFNLDVTNELDQLEQALTLGFGDEKARAYKVELGDPPRLYLYWHHEGNSLLTSPLLVQMGPREVLPMVMAWLGEVKYGPSPDVDGSVYKGFRLYSKSPNHRYDPYLILVIEPEWAIYHK